MKTAVEWLVEKLKSQGLLIGEPNNLIAVREAKEMEKQQIIEAGNSCALKQHLHNDRINKMTEYELRQFAEKDVLTFGEEYYKETFNK